METTPETQPQRTTSVPREYAHIPGWGVDIDPKHDPTYPMRDRGAEEEKGYNPSTLRCYIPSSGPTCRRCSALPYHLRA